MSGDEVFFNSFYSYYLLCVNVYTVYSSESGCDDDGCLIWPKGSGNAEKEKEENG